MDDKSNRAVSNVSLNYCQSHDYEKMTPIVLATWRLAQQARPSLESEMIAESRVLQEVYSVPNTNVKLVYSSAKALSPEEEEEEDPSENAIVKFSQNLISSTQEFDGDRFFTMIDGVKMATPLFICMIAVEVSDVVFAVDSIPAVFGVTEVCEIAKKGGTSCVYYSLARMNMYILMYLVILPFEVPLTPLILLPTLRIRSSYSRLICLRLWVCGVYIQSFPRRRRN